MIFGGTIAEFGHLLLNEVRYPAGVLLAVVDVCIYTLKLVRTNLSARYVRGF